MRIDQTPAVAACVALVLGSGAALGSPDRAIVVEIRDTSTKDVPMGPAGEYLEVFESGSWKRVEVAPGQFETVTTTTAGRLGAAESAALFDDVEAALAKIGPGGKAKKTKKIGKKEEGLVALVGFGKQNAYLSASGGKASPGFDAILSIVEKADPGLPEAEPALPIVEGSWWTAMGEGASSSMSLDSNGRYRYRSSGDIGCGYDDTQVWEVQLDGAALDEIEDAVQGIFDAHGLATHSPAPPAPGLSDAFGEASYTLRGSGGGVVTVHSSHPAYHEITPLVAPLLLVGADHDRFLVALVVFRARVATAKGIDDVTLKLHAGGTLEIESSKNGESTKQVPAEKVWKVMTVLQGIADTPPPENKGPSALDPAAKGVASVRLFSFGARPQAKYLGSFWSDEDVLAAREVLEDLILPLID